MQRLDFNLRSKLALTNPQFDCGLLSLIYPRSEWTHSPSSCDKYLLLFDATEVTIQKT
jgi:hypothetical protein